MATNPSIDHRPDQSFADDEQLFRRVRRDYLGRNGKPSLLAFGLPDMSVNRERFGAADEARKGFDPADWAVVAFLVRDIPPRISWVHIVQVYRLLVRHVPESGNYPHSEVRVWRKVEERLALITSRLNDDFPVDDPDRNEELGRPDALLDPDFHMRWRKHIALACKLTLTPRTVDGNGEGTLR